MAPYMSETTSGNDTLSTKVEIQPSGIRVVIVGAGFAGLTAAIELSVLFLHRMMYELITDEISMTSSQGP
jgi:aspartate oxidase